MASYTWNMMLMFSWSIIKKKTDLFFTLKSCNYFQWCFEYPWWYAMEYFWSIALVRVTGYRVAISLKDSEMIHSCWPLAVLFFFTTFFAPEDARVTCHLSVPVLSIWRVKYSSKISKENWRWGELRGGRPVFRNINNHLTGYGIMCQTYDLYKKNNKDM